MRFAWRFAAGPVALGIVLSLVFPIRGLAEDGGLIRGSVSDSSGIPINGALVVASPQSSTLPERIVFTDRQGTFFMPNLRAGEYTLKVTSPRFFPTTQGNIRLT